MCSSDLTRAGTPRPIIERLNREINRVLQLPEVRERFEAQGLELRHGPPEQLAQYIEDDTRRWARVIREANIRLE